MCCIYLNCRGQKYALHSDPLLLLLREQRTLTVNLLLHLMKLQRVLM